MICISRLESGARRDGVRCLPKLSDQGITPDLVRGAPVLRDDFRESSKSVLHTFVSDGFIQTHKSRRPDYVGVQKNGELSGWGFGHEMIFFLGFSVNRRRYYPEYPEVANDALIRLTTEALGLADHPAHLWEKTKGFDAGRGQ